MYNNPYVEPAKSPGEEIFLAGMSPEAYVPNITAATLFLNGSNDHHGGFEARAGEFQAVQGWRALGLRRTGSRAP